MSTTSTVRRPFGVSFLSIFLIVGGVLDIVGGIVLLTQQNDEDLLDTIGATSSDVTTYGIVAIVFGVVVLLLASALRSGSNFARLLIGVIALLRAIAFVWGAVAYHRIHWYDTLGPVVIYALIAGYLFFDDDAQEFFRRT